MSTFLAQLENFIDTSYYNISEQDFLNGLKKFLDNHQKPSLKSKLQNEIKEWKLLNLNDTEVHNKILSFIQHYHFDPIAFIFGNSCPSFKDFLNLSEEHLNLCLELDKQIVNRKNINLNSYSIINTILQKTQCADSAFILWLLEKGFSPTDWDTIEFCKYAKLDLLKHYISNKFIKGITNHNALKEVIQNNHMDLLKYILDQNVLYNIQNDPIACSLFVETAVETSILTNNLKIIEMFHHKYKTLVYQSVMIKIYNKKQYNPFTNASKEICLWFWANGMKWNKKEAELANNAFMLSFFD